MHKLFFITIHPRLPGLNLSSHTQETSLQMDEWRCGGGAAKMLSFIYLSLGRTFKCCGTFANLIRLGNNSFTTCRGVGDWTRNDLDSSRSSTFAQVRNYQAIHPAPKTYDVSTRLWLGVKTRRQDVCREGVNFITASVIIVARLPGDGVEGRLCHPARSL